MVGLAMKTSNRLSIEVVVNRVLRERNAQMSFEVEPPTVEEDCWLISFGDSRMPQIPLAIPLGTSFESELRQKIEAALGDIGF